MVIFFQSSHVKFFFDCPCKQALGAYLVSHVWCKQVQVSIFEHISCRAIGAHYIFLARFYFSKLQLMVTDRAICNDSYCIHLHCFSFLLPFVLTSPRLLCRCHMCDTPVVSFSDMTQSQEA